MWTSPPELLRRLRLALVAVVSLACGCSQVGPGSLAVGRGLYNEVINETEDQQLLNIIVRQRYDYTFGMLAVTAVTANVRATGEATANFASGNPESYAENLVPLQVGAAFEENPTISYVPLGGETFVRQMLAPITLEQALVMIRASRDRAATLRALVYRINGVRNGFGHDGAPPSPRFERWLDLYEVLERAEVLDLVRGTGSDHEYYLISLHGGNGKHGAAIDEFLTILGIRARPTPRQALLLPLHLGRGRPNNSAIDVQTRSVLDVIRAVGAFMEVPAPHLATGLAQTVPQAASQTPGLMTIRSSRTQPQNAVVATFFRDWWFYIDASDVPSKRGFVLLRTLVGMRLEDVLEGPLGRAPQAIEVDD